MAELATFVVCDGVQNLTIPGGGAIPQITAPTIALRPQFLPSNFSFGLSIGLRDVNIRNENIFQLTIVRPDGSVAHDSGPIHMPPSTNDSTLPDKFQGAILTMDLRNVALTIEGCYEVHIFLNNALISSQPLPVYIRGDLNE